MATRNDRSSRTRSRNTDRNVDRNTDRNTDRGGAKGRNADRNTDRNSNRNTGRTARGSRDDDRNDRNASPQGARRDPRQTDRQTDRHGDRGTARHSDRDADRHADRRALSSLAPPTTKRGDEPLASALFDALAAAAVDDADTLTHGFHSYPARLHPSIAARVLEALTGPSSSSLAPVAASSTSSQSASPSGRGVLVVDPFCGSGTVLVEARRRGLASVGADVNPVALRVARVKTELVDERRREVFLEVVDEVVERSKERVRARAPSRAPVTTDEAGQFEGHVLREIGGLYEEIESVDDERLKKTLEVVLSAIIIKVSKLAGRGRRDDGDDGEGVRKMGRFIPSEIFGRKAYELADRWAALEAACPKRSPDPLLFLEDARDLARVLARESLGAADVILTSPPYAGTYDYARHHSLRAPFLGVADLHARSMRSEMGARRSLAVGHEARDRWNSEVKAMLTALSSSLAPAGTAVLVVGDGEVAGERVPADEHLEALAPSAGLAVVAVASAPRIDWRGGADRHEHVVALRKAAPSGKADPRR